MNQETKRQKASDSLTNEHSPLPKISVSELINFYNLTSDLLVVYDLEWRIINVNSSAERLFGYSPEELIGVNSKNFIHPADRDDAIKIIETNIGMSTPIVNTSRIMCKDGSYKWIKWNSVPVLEDERVFAIGRDITEKIKLEQELKTSVDKTNQFLERITDYFLSVDKNWTIEYLNQNVLDLYKSDYNLNESKDDWIEQKLWDKLSRETNKEFYASLEKALKQQKPINFTAKSSLNHWFEVNAYPSGNGLTIFFRDITESKILAEQLRQSEETFRITFHDSPTMISINSLPEGRFLDVNPKWVEVMGYQSQQVIGQLPSKLNIGVKLFDGKTITEKIRDNEIVKNEKIKMVNVKGREIIGLLSAVPIQIHKRKSFLVNIVDMTDYYNLENEILRLERLNLIGQLAAGLGHEIRNPLQTIRGFLQLLENKYKNEKDYFDLMISELDRANHIITEFLSLSKNRPGNPKRLDINKIVTTLFPLIQSKAFLEEKDVHLELNASSDIVGDEKELKQLILNLAQNGIEAMQPRKMVKIRTFEEGSHLTLAISDQGKGIAPEIYSKLGTPFLTSRADGTGLGLAVCYSIAERHNAKIDVETSSEGTTFFVKFPINQR
ncbi:PAS domain S-box protein [Heliobacterium chlorum]|uniref:histidine kinase n=1 Tax=Heliobacterium chlorum TaxID=2698 RepID=A0ABR7T055_HELCL|nr:PAS domain S-box protein [Heliobacterium chlorum]MBC9783056.1 PAS domain S-box protein [Heliobacterium chlorum]